MAEMARKEDERRYAETRQVLNGEVHAIRPGTIDASKADVAKELITADPGMIKEERKSELLEAIDAVYEHRHTITVVELTDRDKERLKAMTTQVDPTVTREPGE
ncbi:MAG: hypothetical protein U5Q16_10360 [Gammaproteobacteria bacterium]|nr:hypothetical protein [Gammaproteobacteria bacterium]